MGPRRPFEDKKVVEKDESRYDFVDEKDLPRLGFEARVVDRHQGHDLLSWDDCNRGANGDP